MVMGGIMICLEEGSGFMNRIAKTKLANISLSLALLPILLLFIGLVIGFAFGPTGWAIGGILTIGIFSLMPISNVTGLFVGAIGVIKKEKSAKLFIALVLNVVFIICYIVYFIGMIRMLKQ